MMDKTVKRIVPEQYEQLQKTLPNADKKIFSIFGRRYTINEIIKEISDETIDGIAFVNLVEKSYKDSQGKLVKGINIFTSCLNIFYLFLGYILLEDLFCQSNMIAFSVKIICNLYSK